MGNIHRHNQASLRVMPHLLAGHRPLLGKTHASIASKNVSRTASFLRSIGAGIPDAGKALSLLFGPISGSSPFASAIAVPLYGTGYGNMQVLRFC